MSRRFEEIEVRMAEIEKATLPHLEIKRRILDAEAKIFAEEEASGIGPYAELFTGMKTPAEQLGKLFNDQALQARKKVDAAIPLLQLTKEEIEVFVRRERAILQINPCAWVHNSPGWICSFHAASCNWSHSETANAADACGFVLANNEANPRAEAFGQGTNGWRSASLEAWFNFDIPARPAPATVLVQTYIELHGFYIVRPTTGWATLTASLEAAGYQYGYSWGSVAKNVLGVSAGAMGRHDQAHFLEFHMPVGADPFSVMVKLKLRVTAKRGGAFSVGDFANGAGNYMRVVYVNTYSG